MEPVYIFLLCLGIFVFTLILYPLILGLGGKTLQKKSEWENQVREIQELRTQWAVLQSAFKTKTEEEQNNILKINQFIQEIGLLKGQSEWEKATRESFSVQNQELKEKLESQIQILEAERKTNQNLLIENERLKEHLHSENEKFISQKQELDNMGKKFEISFRNLANSILEERTQKFDIHQQTSLKHILEPLQKDIDTFKKDFADKFQNETSQRIHLGSQIENLLKMSNRLSDEANHLTQALKGQVKQQGNWGEAILESILQFAGLQKGVQYFVQESQINESGQRIQPDIRVQYPDNKHIIIDSKVSLIHYERFSNSDSAEDKERHLGLLVSSMKNHIQDLSSKNYQNVRENTLDFVMMFIPVEGAFITAMQADQELWQLAYKKRILLISPTNLIAAMKLVQDFWQKDQNHKKSEEIASKAAALYDKLAGFVENFVKIGESLNKAEQAFLSAKNQLSTGKGNLIGRAEQMKRINGMKTSKNLPSDMLASAFLEEDFDLDSENSEERE
jgi:DNA recombination protein RmuC